jgi:FkbM family methyltransferase
MKSPAYYLGKMVQHVREGTVKRRITRAMRERRWARNNRWWDAQSKTNEFTDSEVEPGVRLRLYFDSAIARDIYCHDHEVDERAFVRLFLRPGDVFADIGANLGLYSVIASQAVGPSGSVFSFEPDPKTHERLLHNLKANDCRNVQPFQLALSNVDETRPMQISTAGYDAYNSFGTPVRGEDTFKAVDVACVSFDSFAQQHPQLHKVTMMKVDVEGWESMVLRGAEKQLSGDTAPVLQVEFNDQAAKALGLPCSELYRWLQKLGYSIHTFDAKKKRFIPHPYLEHYVYDNVFAIKNLDMVTSRIQGTPA